MFGARGCVTKLSPKVAAQRHQWQGTSCPPVASVCAPVSVAGGGKGSVVLLRGDSRIFSDGLGGVVASSVEATSDGFAQLRGVETLWGQGDGLDLRVAARTARVVTHEPTLAARRSLPSTAHWPVTYESPTPHSAS